jgi:molecular chaperone IbpA
MTLEDYVRTIYSGNFPAYNFRKKNDELSSDEIYMLDLALAGYHESEIEVIHTKYPTNKITIRTMKYFNDRKTIEADHERNAGELRDTFLHRGITNKKFSVDFALHEHIEPSTVSFKDGILSIFMQRKVPEEAKPQKLRINSK